MIRIGTGFDVHALQEGESLILGGVNIPYSKGTVAHSDGDVLIHAICDAMLGAAGLGDIGQHFPDTDESYRNKPSRYFLERCLEMLTQSGYKLVNIDTTIILQKPHIQSFIPQMKKTVGVIVNLPVSFINIKATTTEKLGFIGREEGIAAQASVLIQDLEKLSSEINS